MSSTTVFDAVVSSGDEVVLGFFQFAALEIEKPVVPTSKTSSPM